MFISYHDRTSRSQGARVRGPFGSTQARRTSSDLTTPRTGLGERSERRAGSCSCHECVGMGWCAGRDGGQAAPPSLGPFLCNRCGDFVCVRRPRKSPRTEARAESHIAGVVRDRPLSSFNQVDRGKSPLARIRRSPPQPAAARRSPPQPAAARAKIGAKKLRFFCERWRVLNNSTQTTRPY